MQMLNEIDSLLKVILVTTNYLIVTNLFVIPLTIWIQRWQPRSNKIERNW